MANKKCRLLHRFMAWEKKWCDNYQSARPKCVGVRKNEGRWEVGFFLNDPMNDFHPKTQWVQAETQIDNLIISLYGLRMEVKKNENAHAYPPPSPVGVFPT